MTYSYMCSSHAESPILKKISECDRFHDNRSSVEIVASNPGFERYLLIFEFYTIT
jgi:hypothetical protein